MNRIDHETRRICDNFKVGDKVTWESKSQVNRTRKVGVIKAIVFAGEEPYKRIPAGYEARYGFGEPRNHQSYLVQVGNSKRLYWPCVRYLEKEKKELEGANRKTPRD